MLALLGAALLSAAATLQSQHIMDLEDRASKDEEGNHVTRALWSNLAADCDACASALIASMLQSPVPVAPL